MIVGIGQCLSAIYEHQVRIFFTGLQFLLWLFLLVVFGLARFFMMTVVICPVYLVVIAWTFLRLCFTVAEENHV